MILVAGAGGFIGGFLVNSLLDQGKEVVAVDIKPISEWCQVNPSKNCINLAEIDLKFNENLSSLYNYKYDFIYNLAADMGGMGFIENNKSLCMLSVLINTNLLLLARDTECKNFLFSSSACVYAQDKQTNPKLLGLKESDAYPAMPEDGYGWEKLFSERMCRHFMEDFGVTCYIPRYHNVYGPMGTYDGGREKAPAAICRKVIQAKLSGKHEIEIWGDGNQTRSFTYIDDCILGIHKITENKIHQPINLGSSEMVTINELVDIAEQFAGIKLDRRYDLTAPKGVNGRNSDNALILSKLNWEPTTKLEEGLKKTYGWIESQIRKST